MDDINFLPNDLEPCQRLLLAAFQQTVQLRQRAAESDRRLSEATNQVSELRRVLDATAASHEKFNGVHEATVAELDALKGWVYGRRRERVVDGEGQQHLSDLQPEGSADVHQRWSFRPNLNRSLGTRVDDDESLIYRGCRIIATSWTFRPRRRCAVVAIV